VAAAGTSAAHAYVGDGRVVAVEYHPAPPAESGRGMPLRSVDFDDTGRTRFDLAPDTGDVVVRRSALWRFYDFFWQLHIMNFTDGEDFDHPLVVGAAVAALAVVVSGALLLVSRLGRRSRHAARVRS
jgi:hypothetical protein